MIFLAVPAQGRDGPARRQEIMDLVRQEPGLHKSQIQRSTGLAWGTITYHLRRLQAEGKIRFHRWRGKSVVVPSSLAEGRIEWLLALRAPDRCRVLEALQADEDRSIQELCHELQLSRKVIRSHLTILGDAGLVGRTSDYRPRFRPLQPATSEVLANLTSDLDDAPTKR